MQVTTNPAVAPPTVFATCRLEMIRYVKIFSFGFGHPFNSLIWNCISPIHTTINHPRYDVVTKSIAFSLPPTLECARTSSEVRVVLQNLLETSVLPVKCSAIPSCAPDTQNAQE